MFAAVIAAGTIVVRDPLILSDLFKRSGSGGILSGVRSVAPEGALGLPPDDPVLNFSETRIGHVVFTGTATNVCRRKLFDNKNGAMLDVGDIFCGNTPEQVVDPPTGDRLNSVQKTFRR
jgi:hypothetical protein